MNGRMPEFFKGSVASDGTHKVIKIIIYIKTMGLARFDICLVESYLGENNT